MTVEASSIAVPGGTRLAGALDGGRVVLQRGDALAVLDVVTEAISPWRVVAGLRDARGDGEWIRVHAAEGPALVRGDLDGDPVRLPAGLSLDAVSGSVALLRGDRGAWVRFDLAQRAELGRGEDKASWYAAHDGLFLGVRARAREIVALRSDNGAIAWTASPFTAKVDSIGHPGGHGDEVHVRASGAGKAFAARIGAVDGNVRGLRPAPTGLDSWLADLGEVADREAARLRKNTSFVEGNAIVVHQDAQIIAARDAGTARVAVPAFAQITHAAGRIVGIVSDGEQMALVIVPIPSSGEHDLVLVPNADATEAMVPGTVSFASGSVVIVQHPTYGRVTLVLGSAALPKAGDPVILDGVKVKPGGVVKVERWWVVGTRASREPVTIALVPALSKPVPVAAPSELVADLLARSAESGIAVPNDVLRVVERADRDATFRDALGRLGLRFGKHFDGRDVIEELEIEGFLPIWGDGNGDTFGGVTDAGTLAYLCPKDSELPDPLPPIVEHIRAEATASELEASAAVVLSALD